MQHKGTVLFASTFCSPLPSVQKQAPSCCTRLVLGSDLSGNSLTSLESSIDSGGRRDGRRALQRDVKLLDGLVALESLDLSGNDIDTLEAGDFESLGVLQTLCVHFDSIRSLTSCVVVVCFLVAFS